MIHGNRAVPRSHADAVRALDDERVLNELFDGEHLALPDLAARAGLTRRAVAAAVKRLVESGVVAEASARGQSGFRYHFDAASAAALVVDISPQGVLAETVDLARRQIAHEVVPVSTPIEGASLLPVVRAAVTAALDATTVTVRSATVSVAAPVDRRGGQLIPLHHAPLVAGPFSVSDALEGLVRVSVEMDNDVNWVAYAEQKLGSAVDLDDFIVVYLGPGIGAAIVVNGAVVHGSVGLAGEIAQIQTHATGTSLSLLDALGQWELLVDGTDSIDVDAACHVLINGDDTSRRQRLIGALGDAISSAVALLNPEAVLIGGPWGSAPGLSEAIRQHLDLTTDTSVDVRRLEFDSGGHLEGARHSGVRAARQAVLS